VLCSTLAHRADVRARLGDAAGGLADCDAALAAEPAHPGALLSKGALLRGLGLYAAAADCFRAAALASGGSGGAAVEARELAEQCRRQAQQLPKLRAAHALLHLPGAGDGMRLRPPEPGTVISKECTADNSFWKRMTCDWYIGNIQQLTIYTQVQ
jgi:hypothetical protein